MDCAIESDEIELVVMECSAEFADVSFKFEDHYFSLSVSTAPGRLIFSCTCLFPDGRGGKHVALCGDSLKRSCSIVGIDVQRIRRGRGLRGALRLGLFES